MLYSMGFWIWFPTEFYNDDMQLKRGHEVVIISKKNEAFNSVAAETHWSEITPEYAKEQAKWVSCRMEGTSKNETTYAIISMTVSSNLLPGHQLEEVELAEVEVHPVQAPVPAALTLCIRPVPWLRPPNNTFMQVPPPIAFLPEIKMMLNGMLVTKGMQIQVHDLFSLEILNFEAEFKSLKVEQVQHPADLCRVNQDTNIEVMPELMTTKPIIFDPDAWVDSVCKEVGGLHQVISAIIQDATNTFSCIKENNIAPYSHGVLLHGGSGLGKTLLGTAIAGHGDAAPLVLSCESVVGRDRGSAECSLAKFFDMVGARAGAPSAALMTEQGPKDWAVGGGGGGGCVAVVDGVEAVCARRERARAVTEVGLCAVFLEYLDKYRRECVPVYLICITQDPNAIDPSLLQAGRIETQIELCAPNAIDRLEILRIHGSQLPLPMDEEGQAEEMLNKVALRTHGFSGADLQQLCTNTLVRFLSEEDNHNATLKLEDFLTTLESMAPSSLTSQSLYVLERPTTRFSDIGGLDQVIATLNMAVLRPLEVAVAGEVKECRAVGGVLLHGPSGNGKTMLARALAGEAAGLANFLPINCGQLINKFVGETEKSISRIFAAARNASPCILLLDQIETIGCRRGYQTSTQQTFDRVLSTLLVELDGIRADASIGIIVIACTNELKILDPALLRPGRFDLHVHVPRPNKQQIKDVFRKCLSKIPVDFSNECKKQKSHNTTESIIQSHIILAVDDPGISTERACCEDGLIEWLSSIFKDVSCADINQICQEAALRSLQEDIKSEQITARHFRKLHPRTFTIT